MSLSPGSRVGAYDVQSLLGEGGMGRVYKARDTRLGRDVAIKVLPASVANDPERLARFEREAKVLASLSHANIAQIYGLEDQSSSAGEPAGRFLVMELAAGEDLSARMSRGPMDLHDALPIVIQIAHALEAAHERAIVHRDLKPANIKVSDEGAVKVLDFGLAKAFAPGKAESQSAMNSPTLTAQATAAGVILGTAAYMSPEQARGRDADKRADVWAFGVVFFELLTGTRLFQGETISDTLAAVLRHDIPWSSLPAGTPRDIIKLLRRCLERDRKNRLHDIADARIVLEEVAKGGIDSEPPQPAATASGARTGWMTWGATLAAALIIGAIVGRSTSSSPPAVAPGAGTIRLVVPVPPGVTDVREPAASPDGRFVVFAGVSGSRSRQLYIQRLDESAPHPLDRTDGASLPLVSPDGRWIAFHRGNRFEKVSVDGGEPLPIADLSSNHPGAAWLDGNVIITARSWTGELFSVSGDGGPLRPVSTLDVAHGEIGHYFPSALPGGHHVLFTAWHKGAGMNDAEIAVLNLDTGRHDILFKGAEGRFVAPDFIVFFRAGSYQAIKVDPATFKPVGEAVRVLDDANGNDPSGDTRQTDLTMGGTLAYLSGPLIANRRLAWVSAGGKTDYLALPARAYTQVSVTTDGTRAAAGVLDAGRFVIRVIDLARGSSDESLDLPGLSWRPVWYPDGRRLAYRSMQFGSFDIFSKDVTTSAPPEPLFQTDFDESPYAFTMTGKSLVIQHSDANGNYLPMLLPIDPSGPPVALSASTDGGAAAVSRDDQWVAIVLFRGGVPEVYVQPLKGGVTAQRISTAGGDAVAWSRDGRELLYLRTGEIVAVPFKIENGIFRPGTERVWARLEGNYLDNTLGVGADGRMLVALTTDRVVREIRVVVNWQQEIAKKLK
ncbi:MAG TPA: protein kinase [Vicinamibacterales bacterium]|nr:protein kinase [Vicinamibacterales bacterium]